MELWRVFMSPLAELCRQLLSLREETTSSYNYPTTRRT